MAKTWKSLANRGSGFVEIDGTVLGFNIPGRIAQQVQVNQTKMSILLRKQRLGGKMRINDKLGNIPVPVVNRVAENLQNNTKSKGGRVLVLKV